MVRRQIFKRWWCELNLQSAMDFDLAALVPWQQVSLGIGLAGRTFQRQFALYNQDGIVGKAADRCNFNQPSHLLG